MSKCSTRAFKVSKIRYNMDNKCTVYKYRILDVQLLEIVYYVNGKQHEENMLKFMIDIYKSNLLTLEDVFRKCVRFCDYYK